MVTQRTFFTLCVMIQILIPLSEATPTVSVCYHLRCPAGTVCVQDEQSGFFSCLPNNSTVSAEASETDDGLEGLIEDPALETGMCPRPPNPPGPCVEQCRQHSDCRRNLVCCHNGCGRTCVFPHPDIVSKPGSCPREFFIDTSRQCDDSCQGDGDCPGNQKCCRSACGLKCRAPCFHWLTGFARRQPWRLSQRCRNGYFLLRV